MEMKKRDNDAEIAAGIILLIIMFALGYLLHYTATL